MFACFSPGGTRKRSSLIGLISMPKHPLCLAVPQLIVLGFGINNIYFSKSHHYLSLNLFLSVCLSVVLFSPLFGRPSAFIYPLLYFSLHSLFLILFPLYSKSFCLVLWKMCRKNDFSYFLLFILDCFFCLSLLSLMSASEFTASFSIHWAN